MPRFKYVAMDSKGAETEGVIDAENQSDAVSMIRSQGFFPTRVVQLGAEDEEMPVPAAGKAKDGGKGLKMEIKLPGFLARRVKPKQLTVFTRQLATLVDARLPLLRALRILLKQQKEGALRDAVNSMGEAVEGGSTFSEALAQHPRIFDNLFVNMVRAGEAGGVLEIVLLRLAEFMEKTERIKNKIRSAMIYPIVVLCVAVAILTFLLTNVVPKFEQIFEDLLQGSALPALTQFVIKVADVVTNQSLYVIGGIVVVVTLVKVAGRTGGGRLTLDTIKLRFPLVGPLLTKTGISRFTRTLGTLMSSGVPVLQALNIVRDTAGNEVVSRAIQSVHDSVKEGDTMAVPLETAGVFPGMVVSMVDVGEETGTLSDMLMKIADSYDDEVDTAVEGLTSAIEPVMIIMLAVIIGTMVIAMFVPLISIIGELGA